ncbi:MAG: type II toxin-antitoxin system CcdA family antitoxin, partial [Thermoproteota archaeon]
MSVTITVRIPRQLKEEVKKYGIELSSVVKRALEEEVKRRRVEEARAAARRLGELFSRMSE